MNSIKLIRKFFYPWSFLVALIMSMFLSPADAKNLGK